MTEQHERTIRDFLRHVPFLSKMPEEDFDRVCAMVIEVKLPPARFFLKKGRLATAPMCFRRDRSKS